MTWLYGALNITDAIADRTYLRTYGYELITNITRQHVARAEAELAVATRLFVSGTTTKTNFRYQLAGGGRLQRRGNNTRVAARKVYGSWDVALPLEDFGDAIASDEIAMAYMTVGAWQRHVDSVLIANANTVRHEILKALFLSTSRTFIDDTLDTPTLTIQPLANGDATLYPPVIGSETEATANNYLALNAAAISDLADPIATMASKLESYFGYQQGGSDIVVFMNPAQSAAVQGLTNFIPVATNRVRYGDDETLALPSPIPPTMSARQLGVHADKGTTLAEWAWIPAGYMVAVHSDAEAPLMRRVDPEEVGLGQGLQLVANDGKWPDVEMQWRHRFGYGCTNRLNAVVMQIVNSASYTAPSAFTS
jgi:hypothetical protein